MKLLKIESKDGSTLDAVLMIVPDDYSKEMALEAAMDLKDPTITEEIDIGTEGDFYLYHQYLG